MSAASGPSACHQPPLGAFFWLLPPGCAPLATPRGEGSEVDGQKNAEGRAEDWNVFCGSDGDVSACRSTCFISR